MNLRGAAASDIERLVEIWNASVAEDRDFSPLTSRSWREEFFWPDMVLERDVRIAEMGGECGYGALLVRAEDKKRKLMRISGPFVLPAWRGRGVGRALMDWMISESRGRGACEVQTWIPEERSSHDFLAGCGFSIVRYFFKMRARLGDIQNPSLPPGVQVRTFSAGDEEMFLDIHNRAFAENWDFSPFTMEELESYKRRSHFDPEGIFFALHNGTPVGFCVVFINRDIVKNTGDRRAYVSDLACDRQYRRKGIGSYLLSRAAEYARARDMEVLELDVDAENPRALHVYERMGFKKKKSSMTYRRGV